MLCVWGEMQFSVLPLAGTDQPNEIVVSFSSSAARVPFCCKTEFKFFHHEKKNTLGKSECQVRQKWRRLPTCVELRWQQNKSFFSNILNKALCVDNVRSRWHTHGSLHFHKIRATQNQWIFVKWKTFKKVIIQFCVQIFCFAVLPWRHRWHPHVRAMNQWARKTISVARVESTQIARSKFNRAFHSF